MRWTVVSLAVLCGALASCKKDPGPSCSDASGHVIELVRSELSKQTSASERQTAQANLPTLKDALTRACESQKWPIRTRTCITDAKSAAETEACEPGLVPASDEGNPNGQGS